jgi:sugar/nucleoside kinase (ribokinase family)
MKNTGSVLTVGSLAFDSVTTPFGSAEKVLGGSGNYFSIAASLFAPVNVCGVVGEDFPEAHIAWLKTRKIETQGIQKVPGKTFFWAGEYTGDMSEAKTLTTALNVFQDFNPTLPALYRKSEYVFLANIDPELQLKVLEQVEGKPRLVAMDSMNFWITGKIEALKEVLKKVDLVCLNETEIRLLTGNSALLSGAKAVLDLGPKAVIVKRGEYGVVAVTRESIVTYPAYLMDRVVDPTGAGDSFAGALLGSLAEMGADFHSKQWPEVALRKGLAYGAVVASYTIQDFSFRALSQVTRDEIESRAVEYGKRLNLPV